LEAGGAAVFIQEVKDPKVTTRIHTHTSCGGAFSFEDINSFLGQVATNKRLHYSVILAHDEKGIERGRTVLGYYGVWDISQPFPRKSRLCQTPLHITAVAILSSRFCQTCQPFDFLSVAKPLSEFSLP
jgi:hypothetical protein